MKLSHTTVSRIYYRLEDLGYDGLADRFESNPRVMRVIDKIYDSVGYIGSPIQVHLLPLICQHKPVMDHCGMPKHDLCDGCQMRMPGQAPRGER